MNVDNVISRATRASGRSLLIIGSLAILAAAYQLKLDQLNILGVQMKGQEGLIKSAVFVTLLYLLIAHLLNWKADLATYKAGELFQIYDKHNNREKIIADAVHDTNAHERSGDARNPPRSNDDLITEFLDIIIVANIWQRITLDWQHLYVPLFVGVAALVSIVFPSIFCFLAIMGNSPEPPPS